MYSAQDVLLVASGTTALRLAIAGVQAMAPGRPIALPAYCCYDIATAADGADASVVLYDIDPDTLGPDAVSLGRAMDRRPAAVVAAHLYGYPVDMASLARQSVEAGAVLIEDAAQGAGGRLQGALLGSFGSVSILSFGRGKGMTAGAGGALLARDPAGMKILGWAREQIDAPSAGMREGIALGAQWALGRPGMYGIPSALPFLHLGETLYHAPSRPRAMSRAAVGALSAVLRADDGEVERRRALAGRLIELVRRKDGIRLVDPIGGAVPGFLRLPLRVLPRGRPATIRRLGPHGAAPGYPASLETLSPFGRRVVNRADGFPGAGELAASILTLPTHGLVEPVDVAAFDRWLGIYEAWMRIPIVA